MLIEQFKGLYCFVTTVSLPSFTSHQTAPYRLLASRSSALRDAAWISNWAFSWVTLWHNELPFSTSTDWCLTRVSSSRIVCSWTTRMHKNYKVKQLEINKGKCVRWQQGSLPIKTKTSVLCYIRRWIKYVTGTVTRCACPVFLDCFINLLIFHFIFTII